MNKTVTIIVLVLIVIIGIIWFLVSNQTKSMETGFQDTESIQQHINEINDNFIEESSSESGQMQNETGITKEEVSLHGTKGDCWLVIHGQVYDVTEFIPTHPGKEAILQGCGTDATQLFETRPMGTKTPHSDTARGFLENFYIGELAD